MPHIHELIDFTVVTYIVHDGRVLMVNHKLAKRWLPVGGHVELDEDPEEAALREAKEESGLDVELLGTRPDIVGDRKGTKFLIPPVYMDIHPFGETHRHIGMVYFARAKTSTVTLAAAEHDDIRWFTGQDLDDPKYDLLPSIRFYALEALKAVT